MTATPTCEQIDRWWLTLDDHQQRGGLCPICHTPRRCRARADALAELIAHDVYHLGPPPPTTGRKINGRRTITLEHTDDEVRTP